eukprot:scaffold40803_cov17-Tisochrysis_lutea.AAC.2
MKLNLGNFAHCTACHPNLNTPIKPFGSMPCQEWLYESEMRQGSCTCQINFHPKPLKPAQEQFLSMQTCKAFSSNPYILRTCWQVLEWGRRTSFLRQCPKAPALAMGSSLKRISVIGCDR